MKSIVKTESKIIQKLTAQRAVLLEKIDQIDGAIKAENKKIKGAEQRESLSILHKSGVLDDPAHLRALLEKIMGDTGNAKL